jgi:hypothetical protein
VGNQKRSFKNRQVGNQKRSFNNRQVGNQKRSFINRQVGNQKRSFKIRQVGNQKRSFKNRQTCNDKQKWQKDKHLWIKRYQNNIYDWAIRTRRYDNVTLSPLVLGEGCDSVPFNVMEQINIFVPWIFQLSFCICGHHLLFPTFFK